jgi:hypothetical protein
MADDTSFVNAAPPPDSDRVGVFTSPQSLTTFGGASAAVTVVWNVLGNVFPTWGTQKWLLLVISLFVGIVIYAISIKPGTTRKDLGIGFAVALINSFVLAAAALGINKASVDSPVKVPVPEIVTPAEPAT